MWHVHTGRLMASFRGHSKEICDIDINFENTLVASASLDKKVRVWNLNTTKMECVLHSHQSGVHATKVRSSELATVESMLASSSLPSAKRTIAGSHRWATMGASASGDIDLERPNSSKDRLGVCSMALAVQACTKQTVRDVSFELILCRLL